VLVWFAVKNAQMVKLYGLPDQTLEARWSSCCWSRSSPAWVIGLLAWIPTVVRQRREIGRLKRAAEKQAALAAIAPMPVAAPRCAPHAARHPVNGPHGV
jgi:hypothetical protein